LLIISLPDDEPGDILGMRVQKTRILKKGRSMV